MVRNKDKTNVGCREVLIPRVVSQSGEYVATLIPMHERSVLVDISGKSSGKKMGETVDFILQEASRMRREVGWVFLGTDYLMGVCWWVVPKGFVFNPGGGGDKILEKDLGV